MKIATIRSGFNHFSSLISNYFGDSIYSLRIERIEYYLDQKSPIDEKGFQNSAKIDFLFMNYIHTVDLTCKIIKRVKEISPETKIIFISSTVETLCKDIFSAGATACIKG